MTALVQYIAKIFSAPILRSFLHQVLAEVHVQHVFVQVALEFAALRTERTLELGLLLALKGPVTPQRVDALVAPATARAHMQHSTCGQSKIRQYGS